MVKLSSRIYPALSGSTLVEVLVALVMLLSVFAIGMLLFARLTAASQSHTQQQVRLQLRQLSEVYAQGNWDSEQPFSQEHITYSIEEAPMEGYKDLKQVRVYAFDQERQQWIDSLIRLMPIDEN